MPARFSSAGLKRIAMVTMAIDHAALILLGRTGYAEMPLWRETYIAMRLIGRVAFPLFAFLLVEGFLYTRDWRRYALRLLLLAVISEIPYDLMVDGSLFYPETQNTVWVLLLGLLTMEAIQAFSGGARGNGKTAVAAGIGMALAWTVRGDYGAGGVLFILVCFLFRSRPRERMFLGAAVLLFLIEPGLNGVFACAAFYFINRYSGEKGNNMGGLLYLFYPGHILLLYGAGVMIHGLHI